MTGKPTVEQLGIDVTAQRWHRSGDGDGAIEVAMVGAQGHVGRPAARRGLARSGC